MNNNLTTSLTTSLTTCSISGITYAATQEFASIRKETHNFHPAFSYHTTSILSHLSELEARGGKLSATESLLIILYSLKVSGSITTKSYMEGSFPFNILKANLLDDATSETTSYRLRAAAKKGIALLRSYVECNDKVRKMLVNQLPVIILKEQSISTLAKLLDNNTLLIESVKFTCNMSGSYSNTSVLLQATRASKEVSSQVAEELFKSKKLKVADYITSYLDIADTYPEVFTSIEQTIEMQIELIRAAGSDNISYLKENIESLNELQKTLMIVTDSTGISAVAQKSLLLMLESSTQAVVAQLRSENKNNLISIDTLVYKGKGGVEVTLVSTSELTAEDLAVTVPPTSTPSTPIKAQPFSLVAKPKSALELLREKLAARATKSNSTEE